LHDLLCQFLRRKEPNLNDLYFLFSSRYAKLSLCALVDDGKYPCPPLSAFRLTLVVAQPDFQLSVFDTRLLLQPLPDHLGATARFALRPTSGGPAKYE